MAAPRVSASAISGPGRECRRGRARGATSRDPDILRWLTGKAGAGYRIREGEVVGIGAGRPGEPTPACLLIEREDERLVLVVAIDEAMLDAIEDAVDRWASGPGA